jgi:hypothetical protein
MRDLKAIATGVLLAVSSALAGCAGGGGNGGGITTPPAPRTETFTGTVAATGPGSCGGDNHQFSAADGTISVVLTRTSTGENMSVELCPQGALNKAAECTLSRRPIAIGETLSAPRKGIDTQILSFLPPTCGGIGPFSPTPINYTATVTFLR